MTIKKNRERRTKIICTLGPATDNIQILRQLFLEGMNVGRFNFSHGTHAEQKERVDTFKSLRAELKIPAGLMLDTKGPEVRIKHFKDGSVNLSAGDRFTLTSEDIEGDSRRVSVTYKSLPSDISRGDTLLLDDGLLELKVTSINGTEIETKVINGGTLSNSKKINVPEGRIQMPYVSEADIADLKFAADNDFDFVAASFARSSSDIKELKRILDKMGGHNIRIISKIENREGVINIDELIRVSDGIMVARGDMGVEIPFEELPAIQKMIIKKTTGAGKPVITATQMLDSMIRNPRPTRAELTDVANAIYDGTSAIMLSGETSIGNYPVPTLSTMSKIAVETEKNIEYSKWLNLIDSTTSNNVTKAISHATCLAAETLGAAAIIAVTRSGHSARMVSKYRPECSIIASTTSRKTAYQLSLSWGVTPVLTETGTSSDRIFALAVKSAMQAELISNGDLVILTGGTPAGVSGTTNTMKVHIAGNVLIRGTGINRFKATGNLFVADNESVTSVDFNAGDIIVMKKTEEWMIPVLKYSAGIVTEENESESEAALAGRALEIPVICQAAGAAELLKSGTVAIVDSETGTVSNAQPLE